jgi:hypothetical protein
MELTVRLVEAAVARQPPEVRVEPGTEDVVQDMQALPETAEQAVHVPIPVAAAVAVTMAAVAAVATIILAAMTAVAVAADQVTPTRPLQQAQFIPGVTTPGMAR